MRWGHLETTRQPPERLVLLCFVHLSVGAILVSRIQTVRSYEWMFDDSVVQSRKILQIG